MQDCHYCYIWDSPGQNRTVGHPNINLFDLSRQETLYLALFTNSETRGESDVMCQRSQSPGGREPGLGRSSLVSSLSSQRLHFVAWNLEGKPVW